MTAETADWRKHQAFGLPPGSIRALLALAVFGTVWGLLALHPDRRLPDELQNLMFIILGHYFAARGQKTAAAPAANTTMIAPNIPHPLYLPRGLMRVLFIAGFGVTAGLLFRRGEILAHDEVEPGALTLILVGGFLLGVFSKRIVGLLHRAGKPLPRIVEDLRASVALIAVGLFLFIMFGVWEPTAPFGLPKFVVGDALAATIGFYFGSRS